jgi:hypothetical protein
VQPRDLRLLDWKHAAMYPSALLCRERALLAALEHLKCLITREAVLVMATDQPAVLGFLAELQRRLKLPHGGGGAGAGGGDGGGAGAGLAHVREEMPFELHALEVVLDVVRAPPRPASHTCSLSPWLLACKGAAGAARRPIAEERRGAACMRGRLPMPWTAWLARCSRSRCWGSGAQCSPGAEESARAPGLRAAPAADDRPGGRHAALPEGLHRGKGAPAPLALQAAQAASAHWRASAPPPPGAAWDSGCVLSAPKPGQGC